MARKLTDEQEAEIARRYAAGETIRALAAAFECSNAPIFSALDRHGQVRRCRSSALRLHHGPTPSPLKLREMYWGQDKLSVAGLARIYQVSDTTVHRWLLSAQIPLRSLSEQVKVEIAKGRRQLPDPKGHWRQNLNEEQKRRFMEASRSPEAVRKRADALRARVYRPCSWCGADVERVPSAAHYRQSFCNCAHRALCQGLQRRDPEAPRPLILALFIERMAELRKQGLPIGAATMQKAAEPIGAGGIELEAYLLTLTPHEMDEYLDNQLEHDVRAAGL